MLFFFLEQEGQHVANIVVGMPRHSFSIGDENTTATLPTLLRADTGSSPKLYLDECLKQALVSQKDGRRTAGKRTSHKNCNAKS
jgi:hypothetical protein